MQSNLLNTHARRVILSCAALTWLTTLSAVAEVQALRPQSIEPVALMKDDQLKGCGFKLNFFTAKAKIDFDVVALKAGPATEFELAATWLDRFDQPHSVGSFRLKSPTLDSANSFPAVSKDGPGQARTRAKLEGIEGARFIQGLMVGGGSLWLTDASGEKLSFEIPGPMPNQVRASYLNCAGDLFRPER